MLARLAGLADVEQVVLAGGLGGRLERGEAGVADRRRRQPAVEARVVRARALELGHPQRARPVVLVVADRRVDPERHAVLEAVVDHRRHERALAVQLRLALDHRGDDQHVVAREVLALGVRHVDLGEVLVERGELPVDQVARRRAVDQRVGGREQEALGGARAARRAEVADLAQRACAPGGLEVAPLERRSCRPAAPPRGSTAPRAPSTLTVLTTLAFGPWTSASIAPPLVIPWRSV